MKILANGKYIVMPGGGTWPTPMDEGPHDDSLEWRLRYALPDQLIKDRLHAASVVSAYRELIALPRWRRDEIIRELRAAIKHTHTSDSESGTPRREASDRAGSLVSRHSKPAGVS